MGLGDTTATDVPGDKQQDYPAGCYDETTGSRRGLWWNSEDVALSRITLDQVTAVHKSNSREYQSFGTDCGQSCEGFPLPQASGIRGSRIRTRTRSAHLHVTTLRLVWVLSWRKAVHQILAGCCAT